MAFILLGSVSDFLSLSTCDTRISIPTLDSESVWSRTLSHDTGPHYRLIQRIKIMYAGERLCVGKKASMLLPRLFVTIWVTRCLAITSRQAGSEKNDFVCACLWRF